MTIGGLGIWALIDAILILANHTKAKDGTPLRGYKENFKPALIVFIVAMLFGAGLGVYRDTVHSKSVQSMPTMTISK